METQSWSLLNPENISDEKQDEANKSDGDEEGDVRVYSPSENIYHETLNCENKSDLEEEDEAGEMISINGDDNEGGKYSSIDHISLSNAVALVHISGGDVVSKVQAEEPITTKESENIVQELVGNIVDNVSTNINDSLEENYGLISALKEISGMVPPPASMDWSLSNVHSLINDDDVNLSGHKSIHQELSESVLSSTPMNSIARSRKQYPPFNIKIAAMSSDSINERKRTNSLPGCKNISSRVDFNESEEEDADDECDAQKVIEELKLTCSKNGEFDKDIELKIHKLAQHYPEEMDSQMTAENEKKVDRGNDKRRTANSVTLSAKGWVRKDGTMRRCRKCTACKFRCGTCQSCSSDNKKAKAGCKSRLACTKNSSLIDDTDLLSDDRKRMRDDDDDQEAIRMKDLKMSTSPEAKDKVHIVCPEKDNLVD